MPRVTQLQTNFTAGEISPRLHGRVDIAKYQNGVEQMRDMIAEIYGGARRRPSSLFVRETKDSTKQSRLVPFVRNASTAYMLEFGEGYIRVYRNGAVVESSPGVPYEIASPYTSAQVLELDYTQGADTMFLFHEAVPTYKLVCAGDTSWTCAAAAFVETPFEEVGTFPAAPLTPSAAEPVGGYVVLTTGILNGDINTNTSVTWTAGVVTVNCTGHGYSTGQAVQVRDVSPESYNGLHVVTVVDADHFTYEQSGFPGAATAAGVSQGFSVNAVFSAGDIGKHIKINGGVVKISTCPSAGCVTGVIKQDMTGAVSCPQDAWSLHAPAWSASRGYPRTGTLHEQRLILAGSPTFPQTIWGSATGAYLDVSQGTADDDGFAFTIASDVVNPIRYVASNRVLLAFTTGGEFTIQGGTEKPLAPTNAQIKPRTNYGCAQVRPVRIRDSELFVQRAGRKVRSFGYQLANDDWMGPDLSVLAEHLTEGDITGLCWQQEPNSIVWAHRGDGALVSITLEKDQDVTAWEFHEGFGRPDADGNLTVFVESIAEIPTEGGNEVWMVVRRTIGGSTKRYVERLSDQATMDCSILFSGAASATWSGLSHLNGESVGAVGNGRYMGAYTVSGGAITMPRTATAGNIGLRYTPTLKLLPPEIQTGMGSASGNAMRTSEITIRFFETTGCKVNGDPMTFRRTGGSALDQAPELFTGVKRVENLGFERGNDPITITQEEPMPFHILSVTRKFTTNDG